MCVIREFYAASSFVSAEAAALGNGTGVPGRFVSQDERYAQNLSNQCILFACCLSGHTRSL